MFLFNISKEIVRIISDLRKFFHYLLKNDGYYMIFENRGCCDDCYDIGGLQKPLPKDKKRQWNVSWLLFSWYCCVVNEFGSRCDAKSEIEPNLYTQHIARVISDFRSSPEKYQVVLPVTSQFQFLISTLKIKTIGTSKFSRMQFW